MKILLLFYFLQSINLCIFEHNSDSFFIQKKSEFSVEKIQRNLRKFGRISSIQLLEGLECEAHVTFENDRTAYFILLQYNFDKTSNQQPLFEIKPADQTIGWVWIDDEDCKLEQLSVNDKKEQAIETPDPKIFKMDDEILLKVFDYLDVLSIVNLSETCETFAKLIEKHKYLQRFASLKTAQFKNMLENDIRRIVKYIGSHVTQITVTDLWMLGPCSHELDLQLRIISKYIGSSLQKASLGSSDLFKGNRIQNMAHIFRNLRSLILYGDPIEMRADEIDFEQMCPNLEKLAVHGIVSIKSVGHNLLTNLTHVSLVNRMGSNYSFPDEFIVRIIRQNPQI